MESKYSKQLPKSWTVLIYANGNNDLEPEISKSLLDIEKVSSGCNINVIVQLARAPYKLVKTMRPNLSGPTNIDGDWTGVRRYLVKEDLNISETRDYKSVLLNDLGYVNMADPITLKDFICFGIKEFPAKHFMLIISGHGAGFMGISPDYTLKSPQIMSISGASMAINKAIKETGKKIDILLFDSCDMNMIETIYEFGIDSKSPNYLITPQLSPIEGLPYDIIMKVLKRIDKKANVSTLIKNLVQEVNTILNKNETKLLAFSLNRFLLRFIKIFISNISALIIRNKINIKQYATSIYGEYPSISVNFSIKVSKEIPNNFVMSINTWLLKICTKFILLNFNEDKFKITDNKNLSIFTPTSDYFKLIERYYSKISFTQNNRWLQYLSGKSKKYKYNLINSRYVLPPPDDMPLEELMTVLISHNQWLSLNDLNRIIENLGWSSCIRLKEL